MISKVEEINKKCLTCTKKCKQLKNTRIIKCPNFEEKKEQQKKALGTSTKVSRGQTLTAGFE